MDKTIDVELHTMDQRVTYRAKVMEFENEPSQWVNIVRAHCVKDFQHHNILNMEIINGCLDIIQAKNHPCTVQGYLGWRDDTLEMALERKSANRIATIYSATPDYEKIHTDHHNSIRRDHAAQFLLVAGRTHVKVTVATPETIEQLRKIAPFIDEMKDGAVRAFATESDWKATPTKGLSLAVSVRLPELSNEDQAMIAEIVNVIGIESFGEIVDSVCDAETLDSLHRREWLVRGAVSPRPNKPIEYKVPAKTAEKVGVTMAQQTTIDTDKLDVQWFDIPETWEYLCKDTLNKLATEGIQFSDIEGVMLAICSAHSKAEIEISKDEFYKVRTEWLKNAERAPKLSEVFPRDEDNQDDADPTVPGRGMNDAKVKVDPEMPELGETKTPPANNWISNEKQRVNFWTSANNLVSNHKEVLTEGQSNQQFIHAVFGVGSMDDCTESNPGIALGKIKARIDSLLGGAKDATAPNQNGGTTNEVPTKPIQTPAQPKSAPSKPVSGNEEDPFKPAVKNNVYLRMAMSGVSGGGKTYTALNIATNLVKNGKVAVIDSERGRSSLYATTFKFSMMELKKFDPEYYVDAIHEAEHWGYDVLVIDSLSHAWGALLEFVDKHGKQDYKGNNFAAWKEANPKQVKMVDAILDAKLHVIATMRSKTEYVMETNERGKTQPRKVGMTPIQRDGLEYEFDIVADINIDSELVVSKSRCSELKDKVFPKAGNEVAAILHKWLAA